MTLDARSLMARGGVLDGVSALSAELLRGPRQRRALELDAEKQAEAERRQAVMDLLMQRRADREDRLAALKPSQATGWHYDKERGRYFRTAADGSLVEYDPTTGQTTGQGKAPAAAAPTSPTGDAGQSPVAPGAMSEGKAEASGLKAYDPPSLASRIPGFLAKRWNILFGNNGVAPVSEAPPATMAPVDEVPAGGEDMGAITSLIGLKAGAGLPPSGPGGSVGAIKGPPVPAPMPQAVTEPPAQQMGDPLAFDRASLARTQDRDRILALVDAYGRENRAQDRAYTNAIAQAYGNENRRAEAAPLDLAQVMASEPWARGLRPDVVARILVKRGHTLTPSREPDYLIPASTLAAAVR